MVDREKVIKGLEHCLTIDSPCGDCPYYSYEDIQELECERNLRHDALALLKEQEHKDRMFHALEDDWKRLKELLNEQENASKRNPVIVCPHCGKRVK